MLAYSNEQMSSTFVPAVPSPQTYTAVSGVAQFSVCGVFVDDEANGGWFDATLVLGFDATLDVWYGF